MAVENESGGRPHDSSNRLVGSQRGPTIRVGWTGITDIAGKSIAARLDNVAASFRRVGRPWAEGCVSAAAREWITLWPVWSGGVVLAVLFAITLDAQSVGWVRALPGSLIKVFQWLTAFGKSDWLLYPTGSLCLILLLADWRHISRRVAAAWAEVGLLAGFAFISIAGAGLFVNVIKQLVGRGRPMVFESDGAFSLVPLQFNYAHASFPSGHATTIGALAVVVAVFVPRFRWPALVLCGLVASSRVFVKAHYPSDVVAGFLIGAAFAWLYALALARCGVVFARGTMRPRVIAIRHIFLRPGGFSIAMGCLWLALFGVGARASVSAQTPTEGA